MRLLCIPVVLLLVLFSGQPVIADPGKAALVVVDIQADFTTAHKGSLAVGGTDQAYLKDAEEAALELKNAGLPVYATQDWHPANHMSFASNQEGGKPFEMIKLEDGRNQVLWPDHCVQDSDGAKILLNPDLFTAVVRKGADAEFDSYSGFKDDGGAKTGMDEILKSKGIETIIVYGIATDYCVKATVMDGLAAGYNVVVIKDLCRGVAPDTSKAAWADMEKGGAKLWSELNMSEVKSLMQ